MAKALAEMIKVYCSEKQTLKQAEKRLYFWLLNKLSKNMKTESSIVKCKTAYKDFNFNFQHLAFPLNMKLFEVDNLYKIRCKF